MRKLLNIYYLFLIFFSFLVEAREERVITIPKAGTHYLKKIIENILQCEVIAPTTPETYKNKYAQFCQDDNVILMGHCEPLIIKEIPVNERILLLIRDPRDVALSAVDFINKKGLSVWSGLKSRIRGKSWSRLSKKQKLAMILEDECNSRTVSVVSLFESAIKISSQGNCFIIKFEQLSPKFNTTEDLVQTIQKIGCFFGVEIDEATSKDIVVKSFKNKDSQTLNKGESFRYLEEDPQIISFLESKLQKYIEFFQFDIYEHEEKLDDDDDLMHEKY